METFLERIQFDFDAESKIPTAVSILEFGVEFKCDAIEGEEALESLNVINIQYNIGSAKG